MKISIFRGGYQNTTPDDVVESWDEFCDLVMTPEIGQKNGDYFVRGFCEGTRDDSGMKSAELIIIDGDQTLENGSSCVPIFQVHQSLKKSDITHVCYTSFSNNPYNNIHKWRVIIPCNDLVDRDSVDQGAAEIITILQKTGLPVRNVKENNAISQPWFTPRVVDGAQDDFDAYSHDGQEYRLTGIITDSAKYNSDKDGKIAEGTGFFSWENVSEMFQSGTLHQGLKSAVGWMVFSTDWADVQIKQMLAGYIHLCPDKEKVDRAINKGEIDSLIKYCRKKSGTGQNVSANWKDHLISAAELEHKEFAEVVWAVDGVIPEGLTVLAGDPKTGKSLMAVDICGAISSGKKAFGNCKCVKGDSVYISLEDPQRRVKQRIKQQRNLWPDTFHLVDGGISQIGEQFYKDFEEMLLLWPKTRAIIIDTMAFVIPQKQQGISDYDHYYHVLDPLHRWALTNHTAVILITHKNKSKQQNGDNPFSAIIGSVAIQGTADAMLMLSRNYTKKDGDGIDTPDGFLNVVGRETDSFCYAMEFDAEATRWAIMGEMKEKENKNVNANWLSISMTIDKKQKTPTEISKETGINVSTVKTCLTRMKKENLIMSNGAGGWVSIQPGDENF